MGSSASSPSTAAPAASRVSGLSYARLLRQLEKKQNEIQNLKIKVKTLESELANYKKLLRKSGGVPIRAPLDSSEKSDSEYDGSDIDDFIRIPNDTSDVQPQGNLPKVGDHVVSMWGVSKWQYFTATIVSFDRKTLKYTIDWDDGDPTGRVIDYYNLAIDKVPAEDQVGVGTKVLFPQGQYRQQEVHGVTRSEGMRWHQGEITNVTKAADGTKLYHGRHTKGQADGKWVSYKDYSEEFTDYKLEDFRMPPNVFDILDSVADSQARQNSSQPPSATEEEEIDVFISYAVVNSPSAVKNKEISASDLPPSYEQVMIDDLCDPRDIVGYLKEMGVKVYFTEKEDESSLLEIASTLKRSKVFIACLSDEYASNDRCRMEFQHAKKTLKIPVIPIVVGTGSFQWKMTVVGLLIAGELYIHFKDRNVQGFKMNELLRAIKRHIPELQLRNMQFAATGDATLDLVSTPGLTLTGAQLETGVADIFFSYCWSNSSSAEKNKQISGVVGSEWNDPRIIAERLSKTVGAVTWIDIKRLESAADGMGMFEQIATAITECQLVVACVSNEYAESDNCRMEIQFAASSLQKPLIILVVGEGRKWEETVVGKVALLGKATIDMQAVTSENELESKLQDIKSKILKVDGFSVTAPESEEEKKKATKKKKAPKFKNAKRKSNFFATAAGGITDNNFKAPRIGDHVVCLHQNWAYFMATIVEFDPTDLVYTVDWDDGDITGRVQSYKDVALDLVPESSQVGVGSIVIFPQGSYGATEGNNTGGLRYHQGIITEIQTDDDGVTRYNGKHTKGVDDGKWITWPGYNPNFGGLTLDQLRVAANAMDALYACKQAFNIGGDDDISF